MKDDCSVLSYPSVSPFLFVAGAEAALDFYRGVFGATERFRVREPDGRIGHAELQIGDSVVLLADEFPEHNAPGPKSVGGTPVAIHVHVDDVDDVFNRALAGGARSLRAVADESYGDRVGMFEDPFGHRWMVATRIERVPPDEIIRRASSTHAPV